MRLGVDLDNTLVCYEEVFSWAAREFKLVPQGWDGDRLQIRDYLRNQENGEIAWQRLQGHVYGKWVFRAKLFPGAYRFLWRCKFRQITVDVLSHKSEYGHFDKDKISLRQSARKFLIEHEVLSSQGESLINNLQFFFRKRRKN